MTDSESYQTIEFGEDRTCAALSSRNIIVKSRPGNQELGCSNVTLNSIVNFIWESKHYQGNVIAVHVLGEVIAYAINTKEGGMVRVTNPTATSRGLIKGYVGMPQDLVFAHIEKEVLLASIDTRGNMFVHSIEVPGFNCVLKLHILGDTPASVHRVIWCPYIKEQEEIEDDIAKLLVVIHGSKAVMMCVPTIIECYGVKPELKTLNSTIKEGIIEINEFSNLITDATFAPDGTALALASSDGQVKFFQVYMHAAEEKSKPRCLHQWKPHDGRPVTSLFFLDNHTCHIPDVQYWKHAVTGCDNNTEIKLWTCETWTCIQKIVIQPSPGVLPELSMKVALDRTSQYLFLTDGHNQVLYVINLHEEKGLVHMRSISEVLFPCTILGLVIDNIVPLRSGSLGNGDFDDFDRDVMDVNLSDVMNEMSGFNHFRNSNEDRQVNLYIVQPKSLQHCKVVVDPLAKHGAVVTTLSGKSVFGFADDYQDTSMVTNHGDRTMSSIDEKNIKSLKELVNSTSDFNALPNQQSTPLQMVQPTAPPPSQINLMTPDAFSSMTSDPKSSGEQTLKAYDGSILEAKVSASPSLMDKKFIDDFMYLGTKRLEEIEPPMATSENREYNEKPRNANFASGGSSPSREVQEILSIKDTRSNLLDFDLIDNGVQETSTQNIKPLNVPTKSLNTSEAKLEGNKLDGGWPCPPKIDTKPKVDDSLNNGNTSANSIGTANAFASFTTANNVSVEDGTTQMLEKILSTLVQQTKQIQNLQMEVKRLHDNEIKTRNTYMENSNANMHSYIANVEKIIDQAVLKNQLHLSNLMETFTNRVSNEKSDLSRNQNFLEKFSSNFTLEMERFIVPSLVSSFDSLKQVMENEISAKLSSTNDLLRHQVLKFTQDKHTVDMLSKSLLVGAQTTLTNTLKDYMASSLIPSFERAANQMFKQMNDAFLQGTKDYVMNFEISMEKRRQMDKSKDIVVHMEQLSENIKLHSLATNAINKNVYEAISKTMKIMQENLIKSINENVNMAFRKQSEELEDHVKTAVRSNTVTPSVQVNDVLSYKAQVNELLSQNDISSAFQCALMASDLTVVVYLCEKINPVNLFKQSPCPLPQHVLLSLIQQLGADLQNDTKLKHRYLQEALVNLDSKSGGIQEHLPRILTDLKQQLTSFVSQHPDNAGPFRVLAMMTDSLLKNVSS